MKVTPEIKTLLDAIRSHEAPKGYGQIYSGAKGVSKNADVSKMTLDGVLLFQAQMKDKGSASTACGGYQFLRKTLKATIQGMGLNGNEVWTPELQDRMALYLVEQRGLPRFLSGRISRTEFANNLAKEWASLPVVSTVQGGSRIVNRGQSFYAGDGLNKSFHKPAVIESLLDAIKAQKEAPTAPPMSPAPAVPPSPESPPVAESRPPVGLLKAFLSFLAFLFMPKKG